MEDVLRDPNADFTSSIQALAAEFRRMEKEREKMRKEVDRVEKKLSNQGFVAKAPQNVIEEERAKEEKYKAILAQVEERLAQMQK